MDDSIEIGEGQDEASYFRYKATLRIFGVISDPEALTQSLGLCPTYSHRRGDRRNPSSEPYKFDMWMYTPPLDRGAPLHMHIDALWSVLRDKEEFLLQLKRELTVDVFLGYRSNSDTAGIEIPYQSLEIFLKLQVPFGLSIIIT